MKKTFLSVDLDFWCLHKKRTESFEHLMFKLFKLGVPINCVMYHHEMLSLVNEQPIDKLINIDYHSDFADIDNNRLTKEYFNEGTWINFVEESNKSEFLWIYPQKSCTLTTEGACYENYDPFVVCSEDAIKLTQWKSSKKRISTKNILNDDELSCVTSVGISISPDWNTKEFCVASLKFLKSFGVISKEEYLNFETIIQQEKLSYHEQNKIDVVNRFFSCSVC